MNFITLDEAVVGIFFSFIFEKITCYVDENTPVPKRKPHVEFLLDLSAVFLSTSALIVSIIQTTIFSEQQYASVWPYLQTTYSFRSGFYDYRIEIID